MHHGTQRYCVLFKEAGMSERKFMTHSAKDCTGHRTNRNIKDGMGGYVVIRADTVRQYKKSENKWEKDLKSLNKQNKILYSIAKNSGSRHDIKKIKKIHAKASKKSCDYSINFSSDDFYSNS